MKFDAMDKFNLHSERKERSKVLVLILIIILFTVVFILLVYLNSVKLSRIELVILGLSDDFKQDFYAIIKDKTILLTILPNFDDRIEQLYYIEKIKIHHVSIKKIIFSISEKKPYCIVYDRNNGIFYQITKDFIVLRKIFNNSILNYYIVSIDFPKIFNKGEKIEFLNNKIDLYNEDYQLSEIIVDKGNIFGIPVKHKNIILFGTFVDKVKLKNLRLLFSFMDDKKEDVRFSRIKYIDFTYSDIARIIFE
ncbi:MAG: hypothetical protein GYA61_01580 [Spirochaetales bacterium]|nr:hypothetical protein [Spirochaetales bacterium]